jgi:hypothetical protein
MDTIYIIAITATLSACITGVIVFYFAYHSGYMTAVEERFEEENHNENY